MEIDYHKPETLNEARNLRQSLTHSQFIAGGTDLLTKIQSNHKKKNLISLQNIDNIKGIDLGTITKIGSMTTINAILEDENLQNNYPILCQAAKELGSPQIRNMATIGGNICNASPCADTALPLLVLDAKLKICKENQIQEIPIDEFFKGPGQSTLSSSDILTDIILPLPHPETKMIFYKKGRVKMDIAIASLAMSLQISNKYCQKARIAVGSVAPVPKRLLSVENHLENQPIEKLTPSILPELYELVSKEISPISDVRSTAEYRRSIIEVFLKRALKTLLDWEI